MTVRTILLGILVAGLLLTLTAIAGAQSPPIGPPSGGGLEYAVATGGSSLYIIRSSGAWGSTNVRALDSIGGTNLTGVAVRGNMVYVADRVSNSLYVGQLQEVADSPRIDWLAQAIPLTSGGLYVSAPKRLAVDASGGVYVIGDMWMDEQENEHYDYAYVRPSSGDWTEGANVYIGQLDSSPMADVAAFAGGAILAHEYRGPGGSLRSYVTGLGGAGTRTDLDIDNYGPRAIAALSVGDVPVAYIANNWLVSSNQYAGSVTAINALSQSKIGSTLVLPNDFAPVTIAAWMVDGTGYIGMVGTSTLLDGQGSVTETRHQAIRITLGPDGAPMVSSMRTYSVGAGARTTNYACAASSENGIFWFTSPDANMVTALDSNWNFAGSYSVNSAGRIAVYVPEPSTLATLLAPLAAAALAFRRRRTV